ncbi:MAG: HAMP domain-containing sensor histidine kinase [Myxococcota bacterium]
MDRAAAPLASVHWDEEVEAMSSPPEDEAPRRHRRHGRAKRRREARAQAELDRAHERELRGLRMRELADVDPALLSDDERAYLEAHRSAEEKVALMRDLAKPALITTILLVLVWPVGVVALLYNAWRHGRRAYRVFVEPELRDRFVDGEVSKRLDQRVQAQRRAIETEHARSLEKLSASIAHEIRNPITAAKSLVQQMGEEPGSSDNVEYARIALGELERVERSVSHLLRFAREEERREQPVLLGDVLASALETFRERAEREGVAIERSYDCDGAVTGDPEQLRRIAINLVGNAIDALCEARTPSPRVEVALGENLAGTHVWMRVRDNGPGMEPDVAARVFDPFFTAKTSGTGLGLPITRKLVEAHGGAIEVASEPGRGTELLVTLPKRAQADAR